VTAKLARLRLLYIENGTFWSVILFDDIEKADPAVHKLLLTILSEGKVAMGDGEVTDFRNSVIIMTSNIGARGIQEMVRGGQPVGFAVPSGVKSKTELDRLIYRKMIAGDKPELEKFFDPEFVGRIRDDIVVLETLSFADYLQVVEVQLAQIALEVTSIFAQKKQVPPVLSFDERFKEFLLKKGLDPRYGARVVAGVAKKKVLDRLSRAIINGELQPGDCILFTYTGDPSDEELNSDLIQLKRAPRTGEQV
ncbi:MAG: ATP-dependent Clp protease ATP-binding subunit, partial [Parcubacteria group bacterium]|nr:ATP-dependent Clp protease ATP-binding subunit [Parcubacteria group bacterium]